MEAFHCLTRMAAQQDNSHPSRPSHHPRPENHKHYLGYGRNQCEHPGHTEKHAQVAKPPGKSSRLQSGQAEQQHPWAACQYRPGRCLSRLAAKEIGDDSRWQKAKTSTTLTIVIGTMKAYTCQPSVECSPIPWPRPYNFSIHCPFELNWSPGDRAARPAGHTPG